MPGETQETVEETSAEEHFPHQAVALGKAGGQEIREACGAALSQSGGQHEGGSPQEKDN
jgi:hypothetical protein